MLCARNQRAGKRAVLEAVWKLHWQGLPGSLPRAVGAAEPLPGPAHVELDFTMVFRHGINTKSGFTTTGRVCPREKKSQGMNIWRTSMGGTRGHDIEYNLTTPLISLKPYKQYKICSLIVATVPCVLCS